MLTRAMVTDAFRGSVAVRAGDLSPTILRGPYWRRIFRDVYIPSNVEGRPLSAVPRSGAHPALPEEDVVVRGGLRLTTAARTAWDLARQPDLVEAVVALDALAGSRLVTLAELQLRLDEAYARKGSRRARRAIGLMDPRAESYPESRLRVRLNRLLGAGWLVLHVTAGQMRDDFAGVAYEIRQTLASRTFRESAERGSAGEVPGGEV